MIVKIKHIKELHSVEVLDGKEYPCYYDKWVLDDRYVNLCIHGDSFSVQAKDVEFCIPLEAPKSQFDRPPRLVIEAAFGYGIHRVNKISYANNIMSSEVAEEVHEFELDTEKDYARNFVVCVQRTRADNGEQLWAEALPLPAYVKEREENPTFALSEAKPE